MSRHDTAGELLLLVPPDLDILFDLGVLGERDDNMELFDGLIRDAAAADECFVLQPELSNLMCSC